MKNQNIVQSLVQATRATIPVEGGDEQTRRDTTYTRQVHRQQSTAPALGQTIPVEGGDEQTRRDTTYTRQVHRQQSTAPALA